MQIGVGEFDNCPDRTPNSKPGTVGIRNAIGTTADIAQVETAIDQISADGGTKEPYGSAVWLFATGDTGALKANMAPSDCPDSTVGYGCVRNDALPILVLIGDELYSEGNACAFAPDPKDVGAALNDMGAKIIVMGNTVQYGSSGELVRGQEWLTIAQTSGSVMANGDPYFYSFEEGDLGNLVVDAVTTLADEVPIDLTAVARDLDDDGVDATVFIDRIELNITGGTVDPTDATRICVGGLDAQDMNFDGHMDTFVGVRPGTPVCFDVIPAMNNTVEPKEEPAIYKAAIDVVGDGGTVLDTREIIFLVPPKDPEYSDLGAV